MPLRFPRPVMPVIATGLAAVWVVAAGAPAFADQVRDQEWWLSTLHVRQAWQASRGAGVTIAVLSDGVTSTQADIAGTVTTGPDFTGTAQASGPFFGQQGTAIASLIAGRGHGTGHATGILGVAPRSRILSVRVTLDPADTALDSATAGAALPSAIAEGIRYAVAHHAKVIELPQDPGEPDPAVVAAIPIQRNPDGTMPTHPAQTAGITAAAGGSAAEQAAVAYALRKKVVLVAPAGDNAEGTDAVNYPAAYRGVISVGAFSQSFSRAPYSSHQPSVTLTAAGEGVIAATADGTYADANSTRAASAVVAGVAALIRSRYPGLTPAQVTRALTTSTAIKPAGNGTAGSGAGTVDAQRALLAAAAMAAPADARAGAGAQAFASPAAPDASPVSSNALAPRILRAAAISAGVLIAALLAVLSYSAVARRRDRRRSPATAQWASSAQNAYSPYGSADGDKMLEFFAAPAAEPVGAGGSFPQFQAGQLTGAGFGSGQPDSGPAGQASEASGVGVGAWVPLGGSARAASRAQVSGTPPWEPAAKPDSELPWAAAPGPVLGAASRASTRIHPAGRDGDSIWPTADSPTGYSPVSDSPVSDSPPGGGAGASDPGTASGPGSASSPGSAWDVAAGAASAFPADLAGEPAPRPAEPEADTGRDSGYAAAAEDGDSPPPPEMLAPGGGRRRRSSPAEDSAPRSPSGSNWDLPGSEPETAASGAADAAWPAPGDAVAGGWPASGDGFRAPASAGGWTPPEGDDRWEMPASPASPASAAGEPSWPPSGTSGSWERAADSGGYAGPAAEPPEPDMHWLPAAATDQWRSADATGQWTSGEATGQRTSGDATGQRTSGDATGQRTSAAASGSWTAATGSDRDETRWQPGQAAGPAAGHGPGTAGAPWEAAPATGWEPAGDAGWQAGSEPAEPRWNSGGQDSQPWGSAAGNAPDWAAAPDDTAAAASTSADAGLAPGRADAPADWEAAAASTAAAAKAAASAPWEPAAEPPSWGSGDPAEPADDPGPAWQRSAWRPSAQTESFPAVTDE